MEIWPQVNLTKTYRDFTHSLQAYSSLVRLLCPKVSFPVPFNSSFTNYAPIQRYIFSDTSSVVRDKNHKTQSTKHICNSVSNLNSAPSDISYNTGYRVVDKIFNSMWKIPCLNSRPETYTCWLCHNNILTWAANPNKYLPYHPLH
jgi:hypothetical protein